jgi:hypothetical protein
VIRDAAVSKDLHGHAWMHVESRQEGTAGLASAMPRNRRYVRLDDTAIEVPVEVTRFYGRPVAGRDDQIGVDPSGCRSCPVSCLVFLAQLQRGGAQLGQRHGGFRRFALDLTADELAVDPLELLADVQLGRTGLAVNSAGRCKGTVYFGGAQFPGGTVDFSDARDWSFPPTFP